MFLFLGVSHRWRRQGKASPDFTKDVSTVPPGQTVKLAAPETAQHERFRKPIHDSFGSVTR